MENHSKLPILEITRLSYKNTAKNLPSYIKETWHFWSIVFVGSTILLFSDELMDSFDWLLIVLFPLILFVLLIAILSSIAWHQKLLLGEIRPEAKKIRLSPEVKSYIGKTFAIYVFILIPFFLFPILMLFTDMFPDELSLLFWNNNANHYPLQFCWLILFAKLGLVFPAISINQQLSFRQSYNLTRGNGFRIFAILFLTALPSMLLSDPFLWDLFSDLGIFNNRPIEMILSMVTLLLESLLSLLNLTALSYIYLALQPQENT